ncbi:hypothetical protein [Sporanaerobacter acetigenes]|uniref:Uncharacterized protein n=1 Tax=Sporanaerobacter acetigenes DSM 13106 TaxID=1123281 RepID=A0A1M5RZE6_9FIRM|nr:hypothetical protein [Sporanaerobacter acetigenes]SHH31747.1 hypothetical protein SAMN02745180_00030 [Sporanaerobacter acetigenes DSM 13106]
MLENEINKKVERINRAKSGDLVALDWKQRFLDGLIKEEICWVKEEKRKSGTHIVKTDENDSSSNAYLQHEVKILNGGVWRAVENQVMKYQDILMEDEIRDICYSIIVKAVDNYEIKEDTREGEVFNRLYAYILKCIENEMMNYINNWTESYRSRVNGEEHIYTPQLQESIYQLVRDPDGFTVELVTLLKEEQNIMHFHDYSEYVKTDTLQTIEQAIEDTLTEYEKSILHILAISDNNNAQAGKILKEIEILQGKEPRTSDDAYRVHIKRQKDKIIKKINKNIDSEKVVKINRLKEEKQGIQEFLKSDTTNKSVIQYILDNLKEEYILNIMYDIDDKHRQFLIKNFIHTYNEDKLFSKTTKEICDIITQELYNYIKTLDNKIENMDVKKVKIKATQPAPVIPEFEVDTNTYLYIKDDKFTNEYKKEYAKKGIKVEKQGEKVIHNERYYLVYVNKAEDRMDWKKARKTQYHTVNLFGDIY